VINKRYELRTPGYPGVAGTLWHSHDLTLNREVAVKLLPRVSVTSGRSLDREAERRFYREARITGRLGHPGVPAVHDFGADGDELFMVMEHTAGVTVADALTETGPLPVAWAAAITAQVCAVLAAAHERELIHRDLRSSNVVIRADGSVRVLDFGMAAALSPGEFSTITRSGDIPDAACYLAPEVAAGGDAEPASDLYSVGCLLFEFLTGSRVFEEPDPVAELDAHLRRTPPLVCHSRPEAPAELEGLCCSLLAKDPSARPDSMSAAGSLTSYVTNVPALPGVIRTATSPNPAQLYSIVQSRMAGR
jgi:serine/threonine protein kinase